MNASILQVAALHLSLCKSNSRILVVQAAENRLAFNAPN
jgi:hypothetical protein